MTVYTAAVSRGEQFLLVHVPEIDQWTQARSEAEVEPMARDLIATWLDVSADSVEVRLTGGGSRPSR
ncbi:hypothetical protein PP298_13755 [Mycobacteroides abscessus]|uniref:hypothetical protein n=1 Tax=Mycobacteroides abscessus TaxID=36809 RepID=UPI00078C9CF4|nr:hypothetical protein [Mycobacteroides abscessus]AMU73010.1 hypothetical protein A3O05_13470 [Mycobacteroides abscessus]MDM2016422.1 hypothetical protein [Mycobacteroides abscessus]MDM2020726.1 hypothetical protein [Mycobacteroides abscessus]MDM2025809.1 hypothetical protein [Mycobacteroides abscessus]MDM2030147.1 hypothetical protein [Mycobacteroides abscessus]